MTALLVSSPRLYAARQLCSTSRLGLQSRAFSPAVGVARPPSANRLPVQAILQPQRAPPTSNPLDDQASARHAALNRLAKPLLGCLALALAACALPAAAQAASAAAPAAAGSSSGGMVGLLKAALSFILHLDVHLGEIIAQYGRTTYAILFAIVFCETGLVVMPFLPGDSLLFATGALAALGKLNIWLLVSVYVVAATVGDAVNYAMGNWLGTKAISSGLVKKEYIKKTEEFYAKYGGKTVILSRFVPIVRTMAPFVAGIGSMQYSQFAMYNVVGALLWTGICTGAGWAFGNVPAVHDNFSLVVLGIVVVSVLPVVFEIWAAKRSGGHGEGGSADASGKPKLA